MSRIRHEPAAVLRCAMLTGQQLEDSFEAYFREVSACIQAKTYWALLHTILCLPDICAALETKNGEATGPGYVQWADKLADPYLNGDEWYEMRCKVLHQGRTTARRKSKYTSFSFGQPAPNGMIDHGRVVGTEIHLDVRELAHIVINGVRKWFSRLLAEATSAAAKNVEANLPSLVKIRLTLSVSPSRAARAAGAFAPRQQHPTVSPPMLKTST